MPYTPNPYLYPTYAGYPASQTPSVQQPPDNGLIWVQGVEGAKSYLVAPNKTVLLMDSEQEQFFLKSADASGMPLPLRTFKYTELVSQDKSANYITRQEFDSITKKLDALESKITTQEVTTNAEPAV